MTSDINKVFSFRDLPFIFFIFPVSEPLSVNMLGIETSSRSAAVSEMLRPAHVAPASFPVCRV